MKLEEIISEKTLNQLLFLKLELELETKENENIKVLKEEFNFDSTD